VQHHLGQRAEAVQLGRHLDQQRRAQAQFDLLGDASGVVAGALELGGDRDGREQDATGCWVAMTSRTDSSICARASLICWSPAITLAASSVSQRSSARTAPARACSTRLPIRTRSS
jgi:hypothetical protein